MARIEWVKAKLDNWARWALQRETGATGYPKQSPFARVMGSSSSSDHSMVPTDSVDASRTHDAIESMRVQQSAFWLVIQCHYLGDPQVRPNRRRPMSTGEIAVRMSLKPRAVQTRLEMADVVLAGLLSARQPA